MKVVRTEPKKLSGYLADRRHDRNLSQETLAELAGCTRQYIAQLEAGSRVRPSYRIATGLANALNLHGQSRIEFLELAGYGGGEESATDWSQLTQAAQSVIASFTYPAYIHDNLWRLYGWNQAAERLFGVSPSQVVLYSTSLMEFVFDPEFRHHIVPWNPWARALLSQFRHDCRAILQLPSSREVMKRLRQLPDFRRMWNSCDPVADAAPLLPLTFCKDHKPIKLTIVRMQFPGPPDLWVNVFVPLPLESASDMPQALSECWRLTISPGPGVSL